MASATTMYHTELSPLKSLRARNPVSVPRAGKTRRLHKAFLRYHDPDNWPLLRTALRRMGREDLIGNGPRHLVPYRQPRGSKTDAPGRRPARTQHTGLPHNPGPNPEPTPGSKPRHRRRRKP